MLLGIVALASGVKQAIVNTGSTLPAGPCVAMGCGVALFLAGSAAFRHALRIGPGRYRLAAAALALAASAVGVTLSVAAEMALLTLIVAAALAGEQQGGWWRRIAWTHDRAVHAARDGAGLERRAQVRAVVPGGGAGPRGAGPGGHGAGGERGTRSVRPHHQPPKRSRRSRRSPTTT